MRQLLAWGPLAAPRAVLGRHWRYYRRRTQGAAIIRERYQRIHGRALDLSHPTRFTEKLNCRMIALHQRPNPLFTRLADKYRVREHVAERVGADYLTELFWHDRRADAIPFARLPDRYVIKSTHACGQVIQVTQPVDPQRIRAEVAGWLRVNYYWHAREYQYLDIEPRILAEEYLDDHAADGPLDYRFWCFDGSPEIIQIGNHRHAINLFFDLEWRRLELSYRPGADVAVPRPSNLERMVDVAARLAHGIDFVRVDLYNVQGRICFGEMTFTPVAGQLVLRPESWDLQLGSKWQLSELPA